MKNNRKMKIVLNAPVVIGFVILSFVALLLSFLTNGITNLYVFSVYRAPLSDPLMYVRIVGHIFGHANWVHFFNNMTLLLLLGPILEERYGSRNLLVITITTAIITGIVSMVFTPTTMLLGASGIIFCYILLVSFTRVEGGGIPITFILVAIVYLGQEFYHVVFTDSNVSYTTHIIGGIVGALLGCSLNCNRNRKDHTQPVEVIEQRSL